jgi:acetyl esterase
MLSQAKDRLEKGVMKKMLELPPGLATRIFGTPPKNDRGATLDLRTHIFLKLVEWSGQSEMSELTVAEARELYRTTNLATDPPPADIPTVFDCAIPGPAGALPTRVYRSGPGTRPAIVFFHGGGFVIGDLDGYDSFCSHLAKWTGCVVLSVDYRLAPEHAFPAAVEDAIAAFRWVAAHPAAFDIDPERIAVAGDSAGANLSAVTCHATRGDERVPALQALLYPTTDYREGYPSIELFAEGYFLTARNMVWFTNHYMQGQEVADARIAPILQEDLTEQPPCILMTAGFDPLRDEGQAYAERLAEDGCDVTYIEAEQLVHGFAVTRAIIPEAERMTRVFADAIGSALGAPS